MTVVDERGRSMFDDEDLDFPEAVTEPPRDPVVADAPDIADLRGFPAGSAAFVIYGEPRTKKTSNRIHLAMRDDAVRGWLTDLARLATSVPARDLQRRVLSRVRVQPSKLWAQWVRQSVIVWRHRPSVQPITWNVNCKATFYRSRNIGDAVGFFQGLADLLEKRGVPGNPERGILKNDRLIRTWNGSRLAKDKARPRVEVVLTPTEVSQ